MEFTNDDDLTTPPTVAQWTPPGRGAVATLRVQSSSVKQLLGGIGQFFQPRTNIPLTKIPTSRVVYGDWGPSDPEEIVLCPVHAGSWEMHCHGGWAAATRIQNDLQTLGFQIIPWTEQLAEATTCWQAEGESALSQARTQHTAFLLVEQVHHLWPAFFVDLSRQTPDTLKPEEWESRLRASLNWCFWGEHLSQPWRVAIIGRPNVGKSSLLNALLGYTRAIVYDQPGTTRDLVSAETAISGWPVTLTDTAGLRETHDPLESAGIEFAREAATQAECLVLVLDASQPLTPEDRAFLEEYPSALLVANKCDLGMDPTLAELPPALNVSAQSQLGIDELLTAIAKKLVPESPPAQWPVPVSPWQTAQLRTGLAYLETGQPEEFLRWGQTYQPAIAGFDSSINRAL